MTLRSILALYACFTVFLTSLAGTAALGPSGRGHRPDKRASSKIVGGDCLVHVPGNAI